MKALIALTMKDLVLLVRDRANCFFTFIFPVLVAVFFGTIFRTSGPAGKMDVAVVNLASSPAAAAFVADMKADSALAVQEAPTLAAGEDLVRKGAADATVIIPENFEDAASSLFAGEPMTVDVVVSPKSAAQAGLLVGKLNELAFKQLSRAIGDNTMMKGLAERGKSTIADSANLSPIQKGLLSTLFDSVSGLSAANEAAGETGTTDDSPLAGWQPVVVNTRELVVRRSGPLNSFEVSFPQGVVWGLMGCVMAFGASIVSERARGTLTRLRVAPISKAEILAGKALGCALACVIVMAILLGVSVALLGVRVQNWGMMALAVLGISLGFTGLMMLVAGLSKTEGAAQGYGRAIMLVLAMIGGGSIPTAFMPPLMRQLSGISPFRWAVEAIEGALWRQYSLAEMALPLGVLLGVAVIGFAVGTTFLRWADE